MTKIMKIKLVLSILFIGCLFNMPYGYYQLVRTIGMIGFIWLFNLDIEKDIKYIWITSAILINPIIKISLGRDLWNIVDIVWVAIFIYTEFQSRKEIIKM